MALRAEINILGMNISVLTFFLRISLSLTRGLTCGYSHSKYSIHKRAWLPLLAAGLLEATARKPRVAAKSKDQTTMKNDLSACSRSLLSIPEVAWILGVDPSRVCRAVRLGLLPVVRRRGRVLILAHALAHLAECDESRGGAR